MTSDSRFDTFIQASDLVYAELTRDVDGSPRNKISRLEAYNRAKAALSELGDLAQDIQPAIVILSLEFARKLVPYDRDHYTVMPSQNI